ncbi:hypothetical protein Hanom_Chr07g00668831 [Helianthus anomalus]
MIQTYILSSELYLIRSDYCFITIINLNEALVMDFRQSRLRIFCNRHGVVVISCTSNSLLVLV